MTEKIIVSPVRVRALGDVVSPKSSQDFVPYGCTVSSSTDSTYGTVFTEAYLAKSTLSLVYDRWISSETESFTISATLKNSSGSAISSASVYLVVNDGEAVSATTNSSGVATFTVTTSTDVSDYRFRVYYTGTGSICGSTVYGHVCVGDVTGLELHGNKSVIQTDESVGLWASLTGAGCLKGVPVSFYEQWTPALRVGANPSIIQTGDTTDLSAQLCDSDGSLVREAGHTISFYNEPTSNGLLFKDTTERTYTSTTTQINEKLTRIIGLSTEDFTFEYDLKNVSGTSNCSGGLNIGATSEYNPSETIANYRLFFGTDNSNSKFSFNNRSDSSNNSFGGTRSLDTWYHMKLVKTGDSFSAYVDGTLIATKTVDWWGNYDSFDIYFINWKGTSMIKNIEFKIDGE